MEDAKSYIPSSDHGRKEYRHVLLREYKTYVKGKAGDSREEAPA